MFPNLKAEMARKNIKNDRICEILGVSEKTVRNYLNGKTKIAWLDVLKIQNELFPGCKIEYLFRLEKINISKKIS